MPKSTGRRAHSIEPEVVQFLSEFARYLIRAGTTYPQMAAMMRLALFNAAATQATFGNKRLNQSAVAAMTGLTRVEVRKLAKEEAPPGLHNRSRLDNLIDGWITDPMFITPKGKPKRLQTSGTGCTFGALVRKYGGDVPSRAILRELQRHGYVDVGPRGISLRKTVSLTQDENRLRRLSVLLAGLIKPSEGHQVPGSQLRTMSAEVSHPATSERGRVLLNRRVGENMRAFVERVQAAGMAASMEAPPRGRRKHAVTRTRIVLIAEDFSVRRD